MGSRTLTMTGTVASCKPHIAGGIQIAGRQALIPNNPPATDWHVKPSPGHPEVQSAVVEHGTGHVAGRHTASGACPMQVAPAQQGEDELHVLRMQL
ncbi:hypothetical protein OH77DRAFT_1422831 [Trametes cingulata]|nr:hypothetical protein OH77DRAFT_1422831 [Trametes cingulata]